MSTPKSQAIASIADTVFAAVCAYVARSCEAVGARINDRLHALELRIGEVRALKGDPGQKGEKGEDGRDGKDIDPAVLQMIVDASVGAAVLRAVEPAVTRAMAAIPVPRDGTPGTNGANAVIDEGMLERAANAAAERAVAAIPKPRDGEPGKPGKDGERGAGAFDVAKASGFVGSEAEWLLSLRGKNGEPGRDGIDPPPPRDGLPGERGRDAYELDILEGINVDRSYPRGTAAVINGGTFWARRTTDPIDADGDLAGAGWLCLFRGIADVTEDDEDGGRIVVRTTRFCDGTERVDRRKTRTVIYRGTWQSKRAYDTGDSVTYAGSTWIAERETTKAPGSENDDWKMAVKRGKDGRDSE